MMGARVLLVEDDAQMAELLCLLLHTAAPGVEVDVFYDVNSAIQSLRPNRYTLAICDWNLPGKPGLALLPEMAKLQPRVPVLMITGRCDRASVIAARAQGADGFIAKPFQPQALLERLRPLLSSTHAEPGAAQLAETVEDYLQALQGDDLELPVMAGARDLMQMNAAEDEASAKEMSDAWKRQPALSTRIIAVANSSAFNTMGTLCLTLLDAINRIGTRSSLDIATVLALRYGALWHDPRLEPLAAAEMDIAEQLAEQVTAACIEAGLDPGPCHTGALLHRMGEMIAIFHLDHWQRERGLIADESQLLACVRRFGRPLADRLKTLWRYPIPLREMIGAIYALPPGTVKREHYLLRLMGGSSMGDLDAEQTDRLQRLVRSGN